MYAQVTTWPGLSFTVASLNQFNSPQTWVKSTGRHSCTSCNILRQLYTTNCNMVGSETPLYCPLDLLIQTLPLTLTHADRWLDTCSYSAEDLCYGGLKYQQMVVVSTVGAEYMVISHAIQQLQWMFASIAEISSPQEWPTCLFANNSGAIALTENTRNNTWVKHVDVWHHYIWEHVESRDVQVEYVPSTNNLADILTKALPQPAHHWICLALRLCKE